MLMSIIAEPLFTHYMVELHKADVVWDAWAIIRWTNKTGKTGKR